MNYDCVFESICMCAWYDVPLCMFLFTHSGVYGADEYSIALPLAIVTLPEQEVVNRAQLFCAMPPEVQVVLNEMVGIPTHAEGSREAHMQTVNCILIFGLEE